MTRYEKLRALRTYLNRHGNADQLHTGQYVQLKPGASARGLIPHAWIPTDGMLFVGYLPHALRSADADCEVLTWDPGKQCPRKDVLPSWLLTPAQEPSPDEEPCLGAAADTLPA